PASPTPPETVTSLATEMAALMVLPMAKAAAARLRRSSISASAPASMLPAPSQPANSSTAPRAAAIARHDNPKTCRRAVRSRRKIALQNRCDRQTPHCTRPENACELPPVGCETCIRYAPARFSCHADHGVPPSPDRRSRSDEHGQDLPRRGADARSPLRHDRLPPPPPGTRELRSNRRTARRSRGG